MPREADPDLANHILDAAQRLWARGGDPALTMRAVAAAARTTTPTLYKRFRDREDLLRALRVRAQQRLLSALQQAKSLSELPAKHFEFARNNAHEYELLFGKGWARRIRPQDPKPSLEFVRETLARNGGGLPEEFTGLALALMCLMHGTAMLVAYENEGGAFLKELQDASQLAAQLLVDKPEHFRKFAAAPA